MDLCISRLSESSNGISGELTLRYKLGKKECLFSCFTLELPWKRNQNGVSSIPGGRYLGFVRKDGNKGWRIELRDVPGRQHVQIHIGNYTSEIEGCILIGKKRAANAVLDSVAARNDLREILDFYGGPISVNIGGLYSGWVHSTLPEHT